MTIVFIAKGVQASGVKIDVNRLTTVLLIGAVIWAYLGIIFEILTETVAWERWEGTIEYTFMAPLSRPVHLLGMGVFAVAYGTVRAGLLFVVVAFLFHLSLPVANFAGALALLAIAVDLVPRDRDHDRGAAADLAREGDAARLRRPGRAARRLGRLLPGLGAAGVDAVDREDLARRPTRCGGSAPAIIDGAGLSTLWGDIWPLLLIGAVAVPLGFEVFRRGEVYAKRNGKLKRSG